MAAAGNWESDADNGTGMAITAGKATIMSSVRSTRGGPAIFLHIPNTDTTNSDIFRVPMDYTVVVCLNARVGTAQATNGLTVSVERSLSRLLSTSAGDSHRIENVQLTGATGSGCIWGVPHGDYWIDVLTGPTTGTALVTVKIDRIISAY